MNEYDILSFTTRAMYLMVLLSSPMLLSALLVGLLISLLQATTQVQEQTLTFVPKIIVTFLMAALTGTWIGKQLYSFAVDIYTFIPKITANIGIPYK